MYTNYFGLTELPFSIAPNPEFLYMSDRHREALTHLTYGLGDTGGFVLLTGEVGTGKTTVSRCVLEQLPENTQVAFILNPTLSAQELLATICDELKIRYRKTGATLKTLTDKIQEKLLKNHSAGINTILIIDEAQHLQPEVLEQLRLLTNLETNTKKLLQVILIGQPELQQLLQRQDLRQLAQRITARYHLMPLTKQEVVQYIKHRLDVAKSPRMLFNASAMAHIHKLSNGIPRLINLLCDRALLKAYGSNQTLVDKKLVTQASFEALGKQQEQPSWSQASVVKLIATVTFTVTVLVGGAIFTGFWFANQQSNVVAKSQATDTVPASANIQLLAVEQNDNSQSAQESNQAGQEVPVVISTKEKLPESGDSQPVINQTNIAAQTKQADTVQNQQDISSQEKKIVEPEILTLNGEVQKPADFKVEKVEGVSDELLTLFQTAIEETKRIEAEDKDNSAVKKGNNEEADSSVKSLMDMPAWVQNGVPKLDFQMHLYQSNNQGSVKVNGQEKFVGDTIANSVRIVAIEPQQVVLNYQGEIFSLPSLSSWE